jgi:hypothetical protein
VSRIHISFVRRKGVDLFDVLSPDFSKSGTVDEVIGQVVLFRSEKRYEFKPNGKSGVAFAPPEIWFLDKVDRVNEVETKYAERYELGRSFRIHREAMKLLGVLVDYPLGG